jgi:CheY-like chemotaxis protein
VAKRILIAEDDRSSLMLLKLMLEGDGGFEVIATADGEEAWTALMDGSRFDACILDVMMPKTDGLELTRRIRAHPDMKRLPVILCTAQNDRSTVGQAAALSISDYIIKPYARDRILKQVRNICEGRAATANLEPFGHASVRLGISERQLTGFLSDLANEASELLAAIATPAAESTGPSPVVRISAVKGAASNFGAYGLARALAGIEDSFRPGSAPASPERRRDLEVECQRLKSALPVVAPVAVPAAKVSPVVVPAAKLAPVAAVPVA